MPDPKDDPKSSEWRPYIFARDQWHCRICGDRFLYSEMVRKHIANEHNETMPPSMYEYFHGAVWRKKLPNASPFWIMLLLVWGKFLFHNAISDPGPFGGPPEPRIAGHPF